nr:hypothetical protein Hi04_10k_c5016_00023 [uncultured bacterium]
MSADVTFWQHQVPQPTKSRPNVATVGRQGGEGPVYWATRACFVKMWIAVNARSRSSILSVSPNAQVTTSAAPSHSCEATTRDSLHVRSAYCRSRSIADVAGF